MTNRRILVAALAATASAFAFACAAPQSDEAGNQNDAVTTVAKIKPVWKGPAPGSKDNDLDEKGVLAAWRKMNATFAARSARTRAAPRHTRRSSTLSRFHSSSDGARGSAGSIAGRAIPQS
jgi:hypothetical protein